MRKITIGVKPSENKSFNFSLYRSTSANAIAEDSNVMLNTPPIANIKEADCATTAHLISDAITEMDTTKAITDTRSVPFTVKFKIIRSIQHSVTIRVRRTDDTLDVYTVKFDDDGEIYQVLMNDIEQDISQTVEKIDSNTVYMRGSTMLNVLRVMLSYYTEVIRVEDTDKQQNGVEYFGPPLSNIKPITVQGAIDSKPTEWQSTNAQYMKFKCAAPIAEITYYYCVVAKDEYGNVSEPSNIGSASIDQELDGVKSVLYACDWRQGVDTDDQQWESTNTAIFVNDLDYAVPFEDCELLDKSSKFHHQLKAANIRTNYVNDINQTSVGIFIPNIWMQRDIYFKAFTKAFRVTSASALIEGYLAHSNVVQPRSIEVPIERLLVLRTEIDSSDSLEIDIPAAENDGQKVAEWVKLWGRYYDGETMSEDTVNSDVFRDPSLTYPVDYDTFTANTLTVFDDNVQHGKIYRYDIYTWDDYNTESKVLPVFVTCL